jgi:hypothetical protein
VSNSSASCSICPGGYSCPDVSLPPQPCLNGTYSLPGEGFCRDCQPGTTSDIASSTCYPCPVGFECSDPSSPAACEPGFYASSLGSVACSPCEEGYFCGFPGSLPVACGAGTYSTLGSAQCNSCPSGFACPSPDQLPVACGVGEYAAGGASSCDACLAGFACPFPDQVPVACNLGEYSEAGAAACSPCPAGYQCLQVNSVPERCADGFYSSEGEPSCHQCPSGSECPSVALAPIVCTPGYYSGPGSTACLPCPAGSACWNAAEAPIPCSTGQYSPSLSLNCTSCAAGFMCPTTTQAYELPCSPGSFATGNAHACTACKAGHYCPETTLALEIVCPAGTYSGGGAHNCTACEAGFRCSADGVDVFPCDPGSYSENGVADCQECPPGYFCDDVTLALETPCSPGSYSLGGATACTPCSAGYYCPSTTDATEIPCPLGSFATGGDQACTPCPAGFECPSTLTADMDPCGEGYYSDLGDGLCSACPAGAACPMPDDGPMDCLPGTFSPGTATNCTSCPPGFECPIPSAAPHECSVGYYSAGGAAICSECRPGYHCRIASTNPTPPGSECSQGTWCNPASTVSECPPGTFGNVTAAASMEEACQSCTSGWFCSGTGNTQSTRSICTSGHYCPVGSEDPVPCPGGTFNGDVGSISPSSCLPCSAAFYCVEGSATDAEHTCPEGHYCPPGTAGAFDYPCAAGSYSSSTGLTSQSQCDPCPVGHYCEAGASSPQGCPPSTYNPFPSIGNQASCLPCEAGWSCPSVGMWTMTSTCAAGHYCPPGTEFANQYPCLPGTFGDSVNLTASAQCDECPERWACLSGSTSTTLTPCTAGFYCPAGSASPSSNPCPPGWFSNRTDLADALECTICPAGEYCEGGGTIPTGNCAPGHYCPQGTSSDMQFPCAAGTYTSSDSATAQYECMDCPAGYFCEEGSTEPIPCSPGSYTNRNNTESSGPGAWPACTQCPEGFFCGLASAEPQPCAAGSQSTAGSEECSPCLAGFYCSAQATTHADMLSGGGSWDRADDPAGACFNGTYCLEGMTRVPDLATDACPSGHFCPVATGEPFPCPAGSYNPHTGMDELEDCLLAPGGTYSVDASSTWTGECEPGFYCPEGSTGPQQVPCPENYYRTSPGAASIDDCSLCTAGSYCKSGSYELLDCPRGFYCSTGAGYPEPCPAGTYGNSTRLRSASDCASCDPGYFCDATGMIAPRGLCDPGYFCSFGSITSAPTGPGSPEVEDYMGGLCEEGGYCPAGSSASQPCPSGTYNNVTGAATLEQCLPCPPAQFCSGAANSSPTGWCAAGFYCDGGATSSAQYLTPPGYFAGPGAAYPSPCLPGEFNSEYGQSSCRACPAGRYCENYASNSSEPCPLGYFCPEGTDVPSRCPAGTYGPQFGLQEVSDCSPCVPGKYCDSNGLSQPTGPCEKGYFCSGGSTLRNPFDQEFGSICPAGHFCPQGSSSPSPCPLGTFWVGLGNDGDVWYNSTGATPIQTFCEFCPATKACNATGLSSPPAKCEEGYFCKLGSESATPYCDDEDWSTCTAGVCPAGHRCPLETSDPIPCESGTWMNRTGAAECDDCPAGYFCNGLSPTAPADCPIGSYCQAGSAAPSLCPAGTYGRRSGLRDVSECTSCDAGSFCDGTDPSSTQYCPAGAYCPPGSDTPDLCIPGTYSNRTGLQNVSECTLCDPGSFCDDYGLTHVTGPCSAGHFCSRGSSQPEPIGQAYGDVCTDGHYCELASSLPSPCPHGTFWMGLGNDGDVWHDLTGGGQLTQTFCEPCPATYACNATGLASPAGKCEEGYFCRSGADSATPYCNEEDWATCNAGICPVGHRCPFGTSDPIPCEPGSWMGRTGASSCDSCPEGFFCDGSSPSSPIECPVGAYCPPGSAIPDLCIPGTYNNRTGLQNVSECTHCDPGSFCDDYGLTRVSGPCSPGHFCSGGSSQPDPIGQIYGDVCTDGHFCGLASSLPSPCPRGTYWMGLGNDGDVWHNITGGGELVQTFCEPCSATYACNATGLASPAGKCEEGYFCRRGADSATPYCDEENWTTCSAGVCPVGHHCPLGTSDPIPCEPGTWMGRTGAAVCESCPEGFFCDGSSPSSPAECPRGMYCEMGAAVPEPCPPGFYSDLFALTSADACTPAPPGSFVMGSGNTDISGDCAHGFYCSGAATSPMPYCNVTHVEGGCAAGGGGSCTQGEHCPNATVAPMPCPGGSYCATGDGSISGPCSAGHFCVQSAWSPAPIRAFDDSGDLIGDVCPSGHFCETGSIGPFPCPAGTYSLTTGNTAISDCLPCQPGFICSSAGAVEPQPCPSGSYCPLPETTDSSLPCPAGSSCREGSQQPEPCIPGTYQPDEGAGRCEVCPAGFFCAQFGTAQGQPCPVGHFCKAGSTEVELCPAGSFRSSTGGQSLEDCQLCPPNFYQDKFGASSCLPCSSSSVSESGATRCKCVGGSREFQPSDGMCLCKPGYEYVLPGGLDLSDQDGSIDCQPIVYSRCGAGKILDASGNCSSDEDCPQQCGTTGGTLSSSTGLCECFSLPDLDEICDSACRVSAPQAFLDPSMSDTVTIVQSNTTRELSLDELLGPSFTGTLFCDGIDSCSVRLMDVSGSFSGRYGLGDLGNPGDRRMLQEAGMVDVAITNPLTCISRNDSLLFDTRSGCYPVYEKDSLLNTNPSFDFGEFRRLSRRFAGSASNRTSSFGFVFTQAGTYAFSSSCNPYAVTVVSVMDDHASCTTQDVFVPLSSANLVSLGISKNSDLTFSPDWALIGGLLTGLALSVGAALSALYYFRSKAWETGRPGMSSDGPGYRRRNRGPVLPNDSKAKKPKISQVTPLGITPSATGGAAADSRMLALSSVDPESPQVPEALLSVGRPSLVGEEDAALDLLRWGQEDMDVRELVERLQRHHDFMQSEFLGQRDLVGDLRLLLEKEAEELKGLLSRAAHQSTRGGGEAGHPGSNGHSPSLGDSGLLSTEMTTKHNIQRVINEQAVQQSHEQCMQQVDQRLRAQAEEELNAAQIALEAAHELNEAANDARGVDAYDSRMMLEQDKRAIESALESERLRLEEVLRASLAAKKLRQQRNLAQDQLNESERSQELLAKLQSLENEHAIEMDAILEEEEEEGDDVTPVSLAALHSAMFAELEHDERVREHAAANSLSALSESLRAKREVIGSAVEDEALVKEVAQLQVAMKERLEFGASQRREQEEALQRWAVESGVPIEDEILRALQSRRLQIAELRDDVARHASEAENALEERLSTRRQARLLEFQSGEDQDIDTIIYAMAELDRREDLERAALRSSLNSENRSLGVHCLSALARLRSASGMEPDEKSKLTAALEKMHDEMHIFLDARYSDDLAAVAAALHTKMRAERATLAAQSVEGEMFPGLAELKAHDELTKDEARQLAAERERLTAAYSILVQAEQSSLQLALASDELDSGVAQESARLAEMQARVLAESISRIRKCNDEQMQAASEVINARKRAALAHAEQQHKRGDADAVGATASLLADLDEEQERKRLSLRKEMVAALARAQEESEMNVANDTARAEAKARADEKLNLVREEHLSRVAEENTKVEENYAAMALNLREGLSAKRAERLQDTEKGSSREAIEAAIRLLDEEEAAEMSALEAEVAAVRQKLAQESATQLAQAEARIWEEEKQRAASEARTRADALATEHQEQTAALAAGMAAERKDREKRLQERLEKKRQKRERDIQTAAMSDSERLAAVQRLANEELLEKERLAQEIEEEESVRRKEQIRRQEAAMLAAEAAALEEETAMRAADSRKAAMLVQSTKDATEKAQADLAASSTQHHSRLKGRLAKKKEAAAARQAVERRRLMDEEAAMAATAAAVANMTWQEALKRQIELEEESQAGAEMGRREVESRALASVLNAGLVPDDRISAAVEAVMDTRHTQETADLLSAQFSQRAASLSSALRPLLERKGQERRSILLHLAEASESERSIAIDELDARYAAEQREVEEATISALEGAHLTAQLELRQMQLREIAATVRNIAPEDSLKRLQAIEAERAEQEVEDYRRFMEEEKAARMARMAAERSAFEDELRSRHEEELARLAADDTVLLAAELAAQEARMKAKEEELLVQQREAEARAEALAGKINAEEKEKLLAQFKEESSRAMGELKAEENAKKAKLREKLEARRHRKQAALDQELKRRKEQELRAQATFEKEMAQQAPQAPLYDKAGASEGLEVQVDQDAIQAAREASRSAAIAAHGGFQQVVPAASTDPGSASMPLQHSQFETIQSRLDAIQSLVVALQNAAGSVPRDPASVENAYQDEEDAAVAPLAVQGDEIEIVERSSLPQQAQSRLEFGNHLLALLAIKEGTGHDVRIEVARKFPPASPGIASAFRNSYRWDAAKGLLHVHVTRLASAGDLGLVVIHAAAFIVAGAGGDSSPAFMRAFHSALKVLTHELFKRRRPSQAEEGVFQLSENVPEKVERSTGSTDVLGKLPLSIHDEQSFSEEAMQARIKAYAAASGNQHLVSLLERYQQESDGEDGDKYALSDDEKDEDDDNYVDHKEDYVEGGGSSGDGNKEGRQENIAESPQEI